MNAMTPPPGGKQLGDLLGPSSAGAAAPAKPTPVTAPAAKNRKIGLLTSLRAILPACSPNITEGAKGAPPQDTLRAPSVEMVRRAVACLPNTSELFPTRESYRDILYVLKASLPDEPEEAFDIAMQWCLRWPGDHNGPNDPAIIEQDWRRMKPPFRRGWSWLSDLCEQHSGGAWTRGEQWFDHEAAAKAIAAALGDWPDPVDLFRHADPMELGTPPAGSLPSTIRAFAEDEARRKGVSIAFAAAAAVGTMGAAIGAGLRIRPRLNDTGWTEPAALWVALVAPPGSGKSPMISAAVHPLTKLDAEWAGQDRPRHALWLKAAAAHRKAPKAAPEPGPEPQIRRAVVDDTTMEALVRALAENPRGLLRAPDELIGFLASFGAYKKSGDGDRTQALRLFDGGAITIDRVGTGATYAQNALMGVVAGTQPEKIRALTSNLGDDGMLQRFLFMLDDGVERVGLDVAPDARAAAEYAATVRAMAMLEPGTVLSLTPEARAVLEAAAREIDSLAHLPGASAAWQGHISKWGKFLPRLVLIFHAVEGYGDLAVIGVMQPVGAEVATMAARFASFLVRHALQFYEAYYGASAAASDAKGIAGWLLTRPELQTVTRRDIYDTRTDLRGAEKRGALLAATGDLEGCGWLKVEERRPGDGPTKWTVNPKIHGQFVQHAARERIRRANERDKIAKSVAARRNLAREG